jgi:formamidopyrimidine-DNA glycosylase
MWMETGDGPALGLHLGMAGRIVVDPEDHSRWDRFALDFDDGGRLVLRDKRRLGRAVLNPDFSHVGPDAAEVGRDEFRQLIGSGRTPIKARLLNQHAISGIGNLLADQILWQARIAPTRLTSDLSIDDLDHLRREVRAAVRSAIRLGGAHTGRFIAAREREGVCPRDGHRLNRARIGGRTTYWCSVCQR